MKAYHSHLERDGYIKITQDLRQLLEINPRTKEKSDKTRARIRIRCEREEEVLKKMHLVAGPFNCTIKLSIIGRLAYDGAIHYDINYKRRWERMNIESRLWWERE